MKKDSWIDPVGTDRVEEYILSKFPDAHDIEIVAKEDKYIVSFFSGADNFEEEFGVVLLGEFVTSIEGYEIDKEWIKIVRESNEYREINDLTYDQDLVVSLKKIISNKKTVSIEKVNNEYNKDVEFINNLFKELNIKEADEQKIW